MGEKIHLKIKFNYGTRTTNYRYPQYPLKFVLIFLNYLLCKMVKFIVTNKRIINIISAISTLEIKLHQLGLKKLFKALYY